MAERAAMDASRSVQKRAAAAGMMISAMTRISPTARRPITVTATTSAIIRRSIRLTGQPWASANSGSKQTRRNSLNSASEASTASRATTPIEVASTDVMAAVWP